MRQWELIGITDQVPQTPPVRERIDAVKIGRAERGRPVFLWSTDAALKMRVVTAAGAELIGRPGPKCEGRDLIEVFGMEGESLAVLEAHVAALGGHPATFTLEGPRQTVRCQVTPTHAETDRVTGVMCLAVRVEGLDLRDIPQVIAS